VTEKNHENKLAVIKINSMQKEFYKTC